MQLLQGAQALFSGVGAGDRSESRMKCAWRPTSSALKASGDVVAEALERAAQRGVAVYLVMDGVGTPIHSARSGSLALMPRVFSGEFSLRWVDWGLLIPSRWRRLHRKLCVVDGLVAFCGGINILDDFYDPNHGHAGSTAIRFRVCVSPGPWFRRPMPRLRSVLVAHAGHSHGARRSIFRLRGTLLQEAVARALTAAMRNQRRCFSGRGNQ